MRKLRMGFTVLFIMSLLGLLSFTGILSAQQIQIVPITPVEQPFLR